MTDSNKDQLPPDRLFAMGIVFIGAGIALMVAVGPGMVGVLALGVIFMAAGGTRLRDRSNDD